MHEHVPTKGVETWQAGTKSAVKGRERRRTAPVLPRGNDTKKVTEAGERAAFSREPPSTVPDSQRGKNGSFTRMTLWSLQSPLETSFRELWFHFPALKRTDQGHSHSFKAFKFSVTGRGPTCRRGDKQRHAVTGADCQIQPFIRLKKGVNS